MESRLVEEIGLLIADALQSEVDHVAALAEMKNLHAVEMLALADVIETDATELRKATAEIETLKQALTARLRLRRSRPGRL